MGKKSKLLLIALCIGGLAFIFRNQLLNAIQQRLIRSIADKAVVDNRQLLQDTAFVNHRLYWLKGVERLWPHRVNSLRRLRYLYEEFPGFECDIQFLPRDGGLRIGHDEGGPDSFADYLKLDSARQKLFWLDVKNVDSGNLGSFCVCLHALDSLYAIRNRVIIELYDTAAASTVREQGFLTALHAGRSTHSFIGSKQIAWDIAFRDGMSRSNLLAKANDTDLLVCLINVKSPGYR